MSENSSPIESPRSDNLISDQDDQGMMDLPTASLHSNVSANAGVKTEASGNSSDISDGYQQASPNLSRTTMSVHSDKNPSSISSNAPMQYNTAIYDISVSKSGKHSYISHNTDVSKHHSNIREQHSGHTASVAAADTSSHSNRVENAFSPNHDSKSAISRSDSPISYISNRFSNPPPIDAQETSLLSRNDASGMYVRTVEYAPKTITDNSNLISAQSSGGNLFRVHSNNTSTTVASHSSTLDTSNSTYYNREPAYFLAADVKPERIDIAGNMKFAYISSQEKYQTAGKLPPSVPPRPGKRNYSEIKFREILPGELPFAEMVQSGFYRYKDDAKCWVTSNLTDLLNEITLCIIQLTGRCE